MKRKIRLTENELQQVITESVVRILNEGQGWNLFKGIWDRVRQNGFNKTADELANDDTELDLPDNTNKWISTGNFNPENEDPTNFKPGYGFRRTYGNDGDFTGRRKMRDGSWSEINNDDELVDTSLWGKAGRAAGIGGGLALGHALKGYGKARNLGKKIGRGIKDQIRQLSNRRYKRATSNDDGKDYE